MRVRVKAGYRIELSNEAKKALAEWRRQDETTFTRALRVLINLATDPHTPRPGTEIEELTRENRGWYSARINRKDRICFVVREDRVYIRSIRGHYDFKGRSNERAWRWVEQREQQQTRQHEPAQIRITVSEWG